MTLGEAFDSFIKFKRRQGLSDASIYCYKSFIVPFLEFVGQSVELSSIEEKTLHEYIDGLFDRDLSKATRSTYVRHLKCFLNWIKKYEGIDLYTNRIIVPKANKKVVHIYENEEIFLIFNTIQAESDWMTARNRAMIALMLDSGLRRGEVCDLLTKNVNFKKSLLKVCGKGDKERFVPLGNLAANYMQEYGRLCPFHEKYFFVSRRGEPVSRNAIKQLMQKLSEKLPFEFSAHKLRHNFATNYLLNQYEQDGKMDIYKLMIILGHEDVKTTNRYLHFAMQIIASKENISHLDKVFADKSRVSGL